MSAPCSTTVGTVIAGSRASWRTSSTGATGSGSSWATVGGDADLSTDQGVFNNRAGRDDPKAIKFEHGEKVIEAQKRIAVPRRQLRHHGQVDGR